jgi:hypothetical protein
MNKNVWLIENHRNFPRAELPLQRNINGFLEDRKYTTLLTKGIMNRSFVSSNKPTEEEEIWDNSYSSALLALASLKGFISFISLEVKFFKKGATIIYGSKEEWGQIYLASTGEHVLSFSYDAQKDNTSSCGIMNWLEKDLKEKDIIKDLKKWSTVEIWRAFFLRKIQDEMKTMKVGALIHRRESQRLKRLAQKCQVHLPC